MIFRRRAFAFYALLLIPTGIFAQLPTRPKRATKSKPALPVIERKRMIAVTDIEADPDDSESMVRLVLYSNDNDIEGLIAVTSTFQRERVAPETIRRIVTAYGKVRPNLLLHDKAYPPVEKLLALIKKGKPIYGMQG